VGVSKPPPKSSAQPRGGHQPHVAVPAPFRGTQSSSPCWDGAALVHDWPFLGENGVVLGGILSALFGWGDFGTPGEILLPLRRKRPNYPLCPPEDAPTLPGDAPTSLPWPPSQPWGPVETKSWLVHGHSEVRGLVAELSSQGCCTRLGHHFLDVPSSLR